jgi:catechol 2,3-dioxygenase-like lactoylglutathione lyase family enzyme
MRLHERVLTLVFALIVHCAHGQTANTAPAVRVSAVDSVAITVSDMAKAVEFYTNVLTFEKIADREVAGEEYERLFGVFGLRVRAVRLRLGEEHIELIQFLAPPGRAVPADSRSNDRWFQHIAIIVSDMRAAYARLRSFNVEHASSGPQRLPDWNPDAGGIEAFYFRDPDGHFLEILAFPPGKGLPKWHRSSPKLFMGIDHTALVIADTAASLRFYRDDLGLHVVGSSENYGTEQEHLNNVFGARLRITSLRAAQGFGVELLEYLAPRTGRPIPPDTKPDDLWFWQINMRSGSRFVPESLRDQHAETPSGAFVSLRDHSLGWTAALLAHDPDGHTSLIAAGD